VGIGGGEEGGMLGLARPIRSDAGTVSQWFGANPANYAAYGLAGHEGLDYAVAEGTEVLAAHDGKVVEAHEEGPYGLHVLITNDGSGVTTVYGHLSRALVSAGQTVQAGVPIGLSGNTGRSSGPHLHFGYKVRHVRNPAYQDWLDPMLGRTLARAPAGG
jgi:murein DD-endopeptidase MepM/ murein hydrolase activator NlpD